MAKDGLSINEKINVKVTRADGEEETQKITSSSSQIKKTIYFGDLLEGYNYLDEKVQQTSKKKLKLS